MLSFFSYYMCLEEFYSNYYCMFIMTSHYKHYYNEYYDFNYILMELPP